MGPATDDAAVIEQLILAGTDVFRVNFSHGTAADQAARVARVRQVAEKVGRHIGIMGDLQGPKIRVESFKAGPVMLVEGERVHARRGNGPERRRRARRRRARTAISPTTSLPGDTLLLDDGLIVLEVEAGRGHAHPLPREAGRTARAITKA